MTHMRSFKMYVRLKEQQKELLEENKELRGESWKTNPTPGKTARDKKTQAIGSSTETNNQPKPATKKSQEEESTSQKKTDNRPNDGQELVDPVSYSGTSPVLRWL